MKNLLSLLFFVTSLGANAAVSQAHDGGTILTKITEIGSYSEFGGGDVYIKVQNPSSHCDAYWIRPSDPGFQSNLSMALSAFHAKSNVKVFGLRDELWNGSTGVKFCRVYGLFLY